MSDHPRVTWNHDGTLFKKKQILNIKHFRVYMKKEMHFIIKYWHIKTNIRYVIPSKLHDKEGIALVN